MFPSKVSDLLRGCSNVSRTEIKSDLDGQNASIDGNTALRGLERAKLIMEGKEGGSRELGREVRALLNVPSIAR